MLGFEGLVHFFPGRSVGMTERKGWHLSGHCLDKSAVYKLFYVPQLLLSERRHAGVWYCQGQEYLEGNISLSLPHTPNKLYFCVCAET